MMRVKQLWGIGITLSALCFASPLATAEDIHTPAQSPASYDVSDTASNWSARGVLRAGQTADIAAGMSGRIISAPYKAGRYFKRGALLAKFDCTQQDAERAAIKAALATLTLKYENQKELLAAGAAGALDVNIAKSEMQQAAAERDAITARMKDCTVYAPYPGYVITRHISAFETPQAGQPLYSILRAGALEMSLIVPSNWMRWVKPGQVFTFTVDETNTSFKGKVVRTGAAVDPVSQTLEITAKPVGKTGTALAGMSGVGRFTPPREKQDSPRMATQTPPS